MRILLDTHAVLWAVINPALLSRKAAKAIDDQANVVLVSAASAWEIGTKVRKGRLPGAEALEGDFVHTLEDLGYTLLSIDAATALRAARFTAEHRDPFDRLMAAHSMELDIPVISADRQLDLFGIRRIW